LQQPQEQQQEVDKGRVGLEQQQLLRRRGQQVINRGLQQELGSQRCP
jgi:hypothetical protein